MHSFLSPDRGSVVLFGLIIMLTVILAMPAWVFAYSANSDNKNLSLNGVNLSLRVLLQGAYQPETGLMNAGLKSNDILPVDQPYNIAPFDYSGSEQLTATVLAMTEQDEVVDWLLLEIRETVTPFSLVAQQAVMLQRDGDVVAPDDAGVVLNFPGVASGSYRVAIRHRSHLGVLSGEALSLTSDVTFVDFSLPQTSVAGTNARVISGQAALLWVGDANQDERLIASGVGNDSNVLLSRILQAAGNSGFNSSYILNGYLSGDLNMDGKTVYTGPGNDTNLLVFNILSHPENSAFASNFIVKTDVDF